MISRLVFYAGVMVTLWVLGKVSPQAKIPTEHPLTDEELGVAKFYIASPVVPPLAALEGEMDGRE